MIQHIQPIVPENMELSQKSRGLTKQRDVLFTDALKQAKTLLNATSEAEQAATKLTYDFMTGKNENIHELMIAQEKSSILLQFTMQTRNNLLEAYREIMRIPV